MYASGASNPAWNPGDLIADWGTVSVATAGAKAITGLTQALTPGVYHLAHVTDASALPLYGWRVAGPAQYFSFASGTTAAFGQTMYWYDYDDDPNIATGGMPAALATNADQAFITGGQQSGVMMSLRWTL